MKNKAMHVWGVAAMVSLSGCATWESEPSAQALQGLPVIAFGQPVPAHNEYILHFPAGAPIRATAFIHGNAFEREAEEQLTVALRRDIYAYKKWVSFDRRHWVKAPEVLDVKVEVRLPGPNYPYDPRIGVIMNLK